MGELRASEFGAVLRRLRLAAGLTQEALAERARMSVETVSALERGTRRVPHQQTVALLAAALQLSATDEAELTAISRAARRPAGSRAANAHNLPSAVSRLVGREAALTEVAELVVGNRLVTLVGGGGIGKTRVALQVAENLLGSWTGDVHLCDLGPLDEPPQAPQLVAAVFGPSAEPQQRGLLILDNCERLIREVAHLAESALGMAPSLHILATSRERLNVPGERVYRVPALSLAPSEGGLSVDESMNFGALALFSERAAAANRDFSLSADNAALVGDICRRLDGIALAIELAAARVKAISLFELAAELSAPLSLLRGGSPTAPLRHRSIRSTLDWSFELLSEEEGVLLRRLSSFSGPWTLDAARIVCSGPELVETDVFAALASLVEKSLVATDFSGDETWYRLLETTRAYAREKLKESGEEATILSRHDGWARRDPQPA